MTDTDSPSAFTPSPDDPATQWTRRVGRRATDALFVHAFDSNPSPMCVVTLAEGLFREVNASLLRLTGYARAELIGRDLDALGLFKLDEDQARLRERLERDGTALETAQVPLRGGEHV